MFRSPEDHAASSGAQGQAPQELLQVRVDCIRFGTHDTHLYELRPVNGGPLPAARPGAHVAVHLPLGVVRRYSLLRAEAAPRSYLVGVKRDPNSRGGSRYLHEQVRVGDVLAIEPPRNNFPLAEEAPHTLLLAGGIGITPMLCMWQRLQQLGQDVRLVYACRSRRDALFLDTLEGAQGVTLRFDDEHGGRPLDLAPLLADAPRDAHLYCCGPLPMLKSFEQLAAGWPAAQVHVEYFASDGEQAVEGGFVVRLSRSGRSVPVMAGQSILNALRAAGVESPSSCEEGICGACEVRVLGGLPDHRDHVLSEPEKQANDRMMICCSGCRTPELVLDL